MALKFGKRIKAVDIPRIEAFDLSQAIGQCMRVVGETGEFHDPSIFLKDDVTAVLDSIDDLYSQFQKPPHPQYGENRGGRESLRWVPIDRDFIAVVEYDMPDMNVAAIYHSKELLTGKV